MGSGISQVRPARTAAGFLVCLGGWLCSGGAARSDFRRPSWGCRGECLTFRARTADRPGHLWPGAHGIWRPKAGPAASKPGRALLGHFQARSLLKGRCRDRAEELHAGIALMRGSLPPEEQPLHSCRSLWLCTVCVTLRPASLQAQDHYPVVQRPPNANWKQLRSHLVKNSANGPGWQSCPPHSCRAGMCETAALRLRE